MLHMVVVTHGPDTCAAVVPEFGDKARTAVTQMEEVSGRLGITVQGWWVDAPGHTFYLIADAPNAHAVNKLMVDLELFHWNTVDVHPITTIEEAMPLTAQD